MKRFMLLHFGFEKPTPEIMAAWGEWFESVADLEFDAEIRDYDCSRAYK